MTIIGTNFIEINVKKNRVAVKNIKINNNLGIKSIEKLNLSLGKAKQSGVRFEFEYTTKYEPNAATMTFLGEVLYLAEQKVVDEVLKKWEDKKPINEDIMTQVMNSALNKCTVKALILAQELNLPAPIRLPKVTKKQKWFFIF